MPSDVIRVIAEVKLLETAESGRTAPIRGSYRPNHNFFDESNANMTVGFIDIPEGVEVKPGEAIEAPIAFWWWPGLEGQLYPGRKWRIQEGHKLVGIGRIIEVLAGADRRPQMGE